jgi:O-methyltransferase involved in polyketide biosynthesis
VLIPAVLVGCIEKNTVQETLVIPLFGRLVCSERFTELFSDPEVKRICDSLDYDFAEKRKKMAQEIHYLERWQSYETEL